MSKYYFVFDVESIGLHGEAFAVAGGIYLDSGAVQSEFCFACPSTEAMGSDSDREWVKKNVPVLEETHRGTLAMSMAFSKVWSQAKAQYPGIVMAAECGYPVETRFLNECGNLLSFQSPYPLHEIATFMEAAGMDPMATHKRKPSELPKHNPLADSRQSARLLFEALEKINK